MKLNLYKNKSIQLLVLLFIKFRITFTELFLFKYFYLDYVGLVLHPEKMKSYTIYMLILLSAGIHAQEHYRFDKYAKSLDLHYKLGFLVAHRESMTHLLTSHFHTYTATYNFHTRGHAAWEKIYKLPKIGVFTTATFNSNKDVIGDAFGLGAVLTLPKKSWGNYKRWTWNNTLALGMGYLTQKFDLETNPKNIAIGTHLNLLIVLGTEIEYRQPNFGMTLGLDFTHYSNSGSVKPNLGLNIPSLRIGLSYMTQKAEINANEITHQRENLKLLITATGGAKNNYEFQNKVFPAFGLNMHLSKALYKRNRYVYGIDVLFSEANRQFLASEPNQSFVSTLQIGIYNAWELEVARTTFSLGMGAYVYNPYDPHGWFYHRIGGQFRITEQFFCHGYVRSHWAKADFFEVGLGYKIGLSK